MGLAPVIRLDKRLLFSLRAACAGSALLSTPWDVPFPDTQVGLKPATLCVSLSSSAPTASNRCPGHPGISNGPSETPRIEL